MEPTKPKPEAAVLPRFVPWFSPRHAMHTYTTIPT